MNGYLRAWLATLVFCLLWFGDQAGASAQSPLPIDRYWQLMEETRRQVAALSDSPSETAQQLDSLARRLEEVRQVRLPDGQVIPVDHAYLVAQLRGPEPDLERLERLLSALVEAGRAWPAGGFGPGDVQTLEDILSRPEFQWQPARASWWQAWLDKLNELIRKLWDRLAELFGLTGERAETKGWIPPVMEWVALTGGALIILLVLVYAIINIRASLVSEARSAGGEAGDEEVLTAGLALKRAEELSSGGDYRSAVRYLYISALFLLEERGLLRYDRSKTNREYLRSLAHQPELAANLGEVVEVFDRVWYGFQPLDETAYQQYAARVAGFRRIK